LKPTELTLAESLRLSNFVTKRAPHRIDIKVPFADKDRAKAVGAKWCGVKKTWYIPTDAELQKFKKWML
jgi:hypothetical protein